MCLSPIPTRGSGGGSPGKSAAAKPKAIKPLPTLPTPETGEQAILVPWLSHDNELILPSPSETSFLTYITASERATLPIVIGKEQSLLHCLI